MRRRGWLPRLLRGRRSASAIQARAWRELVADARRRAAEQQARAEQWQGLMARQLDVGFRLRLLVKEQRQLLDLWSAADAGNLVSDAEAIEANLRATSRGLLQFEIAATEKIASAIREAARQLAPMRAFTLQARAEQWQGLMARQLDVGFRLRLLVKEQRQLLDLWSAADAGNLVSDAEAIEANLRATSRGLLQFEIAATDQILETVIAARFSDIVPTPTHPLARPDERRS